MIKGAAIYKRSRMPTRLSCSSMLMFVSRMSHLPNPKSYLPDYVGIMFEPFDTRLRLNEHHYVSSLS